MLTILLPPGPRPPLSGYDPWAYHQCTELGCFKPDQYPYLPDGKSACAETFHEPKFTRQFVEQAVANTNNVYGGFNITVTNVLFVNGLKDDWRKLSIMHDINPTARALIIPDGTHAQDMYPDENTDSQSLKDAREEIKKTIGQFLKG